ncbi:MAG: DUF1501 domain-containing protein [Gemmataceae bacterium]
MLRIHGDSGLSRRSFVQAGMAGLGLSGLLAARASQPTTADTSVILFWLSGGPGHMETWDPKPDAVADYRGPFGAVRTSVPGVQFGELMPLQARQMHRMAVLRGVNHGSGDHTKGNHWMLTGFEGPDFNAPDFNKQRRPAMGSAVARLRSAARPGLPAYAAVPHLRGGTDNFFHYAAYLGPTANPFVTESDPNTPDYAVRNLRLQRELTIDRLEDRKRVLGALDRFRRAGDGASLGQHQQQAFGLLTSAAVARAFDVNAEPARLREAYGRHTFGQSAVVARRLVEAGVPFVTVNCVPWDHHGTANRLATVPGSKLCIPPLDRAVAALVEDLHARGLSEKVLVVAMGEFGRTPRMNKEGGRDHWGNAFSVLMSGGRFKMGQVIGKSSPRGEYVVDRPISPQDVAATVYHHLGIDGRETHFTDGLGRPYALIESGDPVRELIG